AVAPPPARRLLRARAQRRRDRGLPGPLPRPGTGARRIGAVPTTHPADLPRDPRRAIPPPPTRGADARRVRRRRPDRRAHGHAEREPMGGAPRGARTRRSLTFRAGGAARRTRAGDPRFPRRRRRSARLGLVGGRNRRRGGVGGCRERRGVTVGTRRRGGDGRRLRRLDERLVGYLLVGRRRVLVLGPLLLLE